MKTMINFTIENVENPVYQGSLELSCKEVNLSAYLSDNQHKYIQFTEAEGRALYEYLKLFYADKIAA